MPWGMEETEASLGLAPGPQVLGGLQGQAGGPRLLVSRMGTPDAHNWPYQGCKLKLRGLGQRQI